MSYIVNDTLTQQAERGEIFYAIAFMGIDVGATKDVVLDNASNLSDIAFNLDIQSPNTLVVKYYGACLNPTGGTSVTVRNLKKTAPLPSTQTNFITSVTGFTLPGTIQEFYYALDGNAQKVSPTSLEAPLILGAGIQYRWELTNVGSDPVVGNIGCFFREL